MRYDVFLAHAGADTDRVLDLLAALRAEGLAVFFDRDSIPLGEAWDLHLPRALRASAATVVCLSAAYEAALYERAEAHLALDHHKRTGHLVIPVWLDGPPPAGSVFYGLDLMQGADLQAVGAEALARQVAARIRSLASPATPHAPAAAPPALPTALQLTAALRRLITPSFDLIVLASGFDTSLLLPDTVPLAQRVMNLVRHASETDASYASFVAVVRRERPGLI